MKLVKDFIKFIDSRIFNGHLKKIYQRVAKKNSYFKGKATAVINEPVADMLLMQYNKGKYMQYQFYDSAVRVLAIENYYCRNDYGFNLYQKMHTLGGNYGQTNMAESYYADRRRKNKKVVFGKVKEEHSIEQFKELIHSYEVNGYREDSVIMADRNLLNMNGAHRTALAVAANQDFINVEIHDIDFSRRFSIDWFWQNGFEKEEIQIISDKMESLLRVARERIGDYYCILYPPAFAYFDSITEDISLFDPKNIQVTGYKDYELDKGDFLGLIRVIYSFDSILKHNLERKLFYILSASNTVKGKLPVRIVAIHIENPLYRLKSDNGLPESMATVRLKEAIRGRYKVKDPKFTRCYVGDYAHDVIIHSTDNYLSNNAMRYLLELNKDLSLLFRKLSVYKYAVIESGIEKLSPGFPGNFYMNDDIDIFVLPDQLAEISSVTEGFFREKYHNPWIHIENKESAYGRRVRVLLRDTLIIMFDFISHMLDINPDFIAKAIGHSGNINGYNALTVQDEISVRLVKYKEAPIKTWHADFIKEHRECFVFNPEAYLSSEDMQTFYLNNFQIDQNLG